MGGFMLHLRLILLNKFSFYIKLKSIAYCLTMLMFKRIPIKIKQLKMKFIHESNKQKMANNYSRIMTRSTAIVVKKLFSI